MSNTPKWQAPGNGKGFDSYLGDSSKMNNRTIGILFYIKENSSVDGFVSEEKFTQDIKEYLHENFAAQQNDSLDTHFYKPALFYGFIHRSKEYNLSLSIEGNLFINAYKKEDYKTCKKIIINQLDNTFYPNEATLRVKNLKLFPFRILFKLLLEKTRLSSVFIKSNLVYISNLEDVKTLKEFEVYSKFNTWVVNSLVDLEILNLSDGYIYINGSVVEHIKTLYKNIDYTDMFFESNSNDSDETIAKKRVKRNGAFIDEAKRRDSYRCVIDKSHKTFLVNSNAYVEGHHVIPMYQQKNYEFTLDSVDNIVSLCPNCHREIHHSDNKKEILEKLYTLQEVYMKANSVELVDFKKMY